MLYARRLALWDGRRTATSGGHGEPWPDVPSDDPATETARALVVAVRAAIGGRSVRSVALVAGLHHQTLLMC